MGFLPYRNFVLCPAHARIHVAPSVTVKYATILLEILRVTEPKLRIVTTSRISIGDVGGGSSSVRACIDDAGTLFRFLLLFSAAVRCRCRCRCLLLPVYGLRCQCGMLAAAKDAANANVGEPKPCQVYNDEGSHESDAAHHNENMSRRESQRVRDERDVERELCVQATGRRHNACERRD